MASARVHVDDALHKGLHAPLLRLDPLHQVAFLCCAEEQRGHPAGIKYSAQDVIGGHRRLLSRGQERSYSRFYCVRVATRACQWVHGYLLPPCYPSSEALRIRRTEAKRGQERKGFVAAEISSQLTGSKQRHAGAPSAPVTDSLAGECIGKASAAAEKHLSITTRRRARLLEAGHFRVVRWKLPAVASGALATAAASGGEKKSQDAGW